MASLARRSGGPAFWLSEATGAEKAEGGGRDVLLGREALAQDGISWCLPRFEGTLQAFLSPPPFAPLVHFFP